MNKTKRIVAILSLAGAITVLSGLSSTANAAMFDCGTVSWVDYSPDWSGVLTVGCQNNNTNYYAYVSNGSSCKNVSTETLKNWKATAELALLSGKRVQFYYTSCGGVNRIDAISLRK